MKKSMILGPGSHRRFADSMYSYMQDVSEKTAETGGS